MYWRDHFSSYQDAAKKLRAHQMGDIQMSPGLVAAAQTACAEGEKLGSLKSALKKVGKVAAKLSPSHQILKKVAPKAMLLSPSQILLQKASGAKARGTKTQAAPTQESATPAATQQIATPSTLPVPNYTPPLDQFNFSSGGGGGGGAITPPPGEVPTDEGLSMPVMIGIGAGALFLLWLMFRKR